MKRRTANVLIYFHTGVYFHVIGEGVVKFTDRNRNRFSDKESYIDFRMRLLGEPGTSRQFAFYVCVFVVINSNQGGSRSFASDTFKGS